ncbi:hypothetical protein Sjap_004440 [Stephania japonica]|uniref:Uncharacterized protein n=1 Tax=Stephania japonica TaxID=461633 RepID=A0AAP0K2A8_9MAGN
MIFWSCNSPVEAFFGLVVSFYGHWGYDLLILTMLLLGSSGRFCLISFIRFDDCSGSRIDQNLDFKSRFYWLEMQFHLLEAWLYSSMSW